MALQWWKEKLKESLLVVVVLILAVIAVIGTALFNVDSIRRWAAGNRILVTSATRGSVDEVFTGEVLRLTLDGVTSTRVFWVFDEEEPLRGHVEAQYAFQFEPKAPAGQARDRRIDAFFRDGDSYETATVIVRTRNTNYSATAEIDSSNRVVVNAAQTFNGNWLLTSASLMRFANGSFSDDVQLDPSALHAEQGVVRLTGNVSRKPQRLASEAWASYEFKDKTTGQTLVIAKPVTKDPSKGVF